MKRRLFPCALFLMLLFSLTLQSTPVHAEPERSHPNSYLNASEIAGIIEQTNKGAEPWASAYRAMLRQADAALAVAPASVTDNGGPNNGHNYLTEAPYCGWPDGCRDGQINPNANRQDYEAAVNVSKAVRNLSLGYAFTGKTHYADAAIRHLKTWALDPATAMNPTFTNNQSYIELSVSVPGLFYGADLLRAYPRWAGSAQQRAFHAWVREMANSATRWSKANNYENWRVNFIAVAGALLDDQSLLDYAWKRYKVVVPQQMDSKGRLLHEYCRKDGLGYSLYALNAMVQTAEIARHRGVNLYEHTASGKGLKLALDYHAPYAGNPEKWPHCQTHPISAENNMALWELAYSYFVDPDYKTVLDRWGRTLTDIRIMGMTSLTHGDHFRLSGVRPPTPEPPGTGGLPPLQPLAVQIRGVEEGQVARGTLTVVADVITGTDELLSQDIEVAFKLSGPITMTQEQRYRPYALMGDDGRTPFGWDTTTAPDGEYTLIATVVHDNSHVAEHIVHFAIDNNGARKPTTVVTLPGRAQAEAYADAHDLTPGNQGGAPYPGDVDIGVERGEPYVGWWQPDEWLTYEISAPQTDTYRILLRARVPRESIRIRIDVDGKVVEPELTLPATGDLPGWKTITSAQLSLTQGKHTLKLTALDDGIDLNWIDVRMD
jgi:hypothetical protein